MAVNQLPSETFSTKLITNYISTVFRAVKEFVNLD